MPRLKYGSRGKKHVYGTVKIEVDGDGNTWLVSQAQDGSAHRIPVDGRNPCGEIQLEPTAKPALKDSLEEAFGFSSDFFTDESYKIAQEDMPVTPLNASSLPTKKKPAELTERQQKREDTLTARIKLLRTAKEKAYRQWGHYKNKAGSQRNLIVFPDVKYTKKAPGTESIEATLLAMQQRFYQTLWEKAHRKIERKISRLQAKLPSRNKQHKRPKKKAVPYRSKRKRQKYSQYEVAPVYAGADVMHTLSFTNSTSTATNS